MLGSMVLFFMYIFFTAQGEKTTGLMQSAILPSAERYFSSLYFVFALYERKRNTATRGSTMLPQAKRRLRAPLRKS
jgi:hypothetical protein